MKGNMDFLNTERYGYFFIIKYALFSSLIFYFYQIAIFYYFVMKIIILHLNGEC